MLLFALIIMRRMVTTSVATGEYKRKEFASGIKKLLKCRKQYRVVLVDVSGLREGVVSLSFFMLDKTQIYC
jgi:hypothetical protein